METTLLYFASVACAAARSTLTKENGKREGTLPVFLFFNSLAPFLLFAALVAIKGEWSSSALLWGAAYGGLLALSNRTGARALEKGPMGLTSAIASFSLIIPFLFGVAVWRESATFSAYLGVGLIFPAVLAMNRRANTSDGRPAPGWWIFLLLTFLTNGFCSVLQKAQQLQAPAAGEISFLFAAFSVCFLVWTGGLILPAQQKSDRVHRRTACVFGTLSGLCQSGFSFLTLVLAGKQNGSVLFPLLSVFTVAASLFCGRLFFGEKLRPVQYGGVAVAIVAVILIKLG